MTRWLTLVGITLQTSLPPLRASGKRTQYFVRPALASLLSTLRTKKSSHPWLNDRPIALVDAKRTVVGTPFKKEATLACSAAAAYHDYTARTAQKMRCIKPSSKLWWKMSKEVMKHEARVSRKPSTQVERRRVGSGCTGQGQPFRCHICGKVQASTSVPQLIHRLHPMPGAPNVCCLPVC